MTNTPIQFNINSYSTDAPRISALEKASTIANKYNISDMSQDEINAEIAKSRKSLDWYYLNIHRRFPISDLRNKLTEIEEAITTSDSSIFLTDNGFGAPIIMSIEQYTSLIDII